MKLKLKFNPQDWNILNEYLKEWDEWRKSGRPNNTTDAIFSIPLIISLMKSSDNLKRLTWILVILTLILAIETFIFLIGCL